MKTLKLTEEKALSLYATASAEFKTLLEENFGKEFFNQKITDRVKTFEDACEVIGFLYPNDVIPYPYPAPNSDSQKAINAFAKLQLICRALNEGWKPDWKNPNQYKYYPWFEANSAGFGFSFTYYVRWNTNTNVGARLCFKTSELAEYAGKQFIDIYNDFLTLK